MPPSILGRPASPSWKKRLGHGRAASPSQTWRNRRRFCIQVSDEARGSNRTS
ncbi:MAG: hypothetical protein IPO28_14945 [Holophagaceae bacterium]|nr:hypothetical protein [Holophagaceae bacterium]